MTRGSTQTVTVPLPYTSANQYPSFGTESSNAKASRTLAACTRATERARSAFVILKPVQRKRVASPPLPSQTIGSQTNRTSTPECARKGPPQACLTMRGSGQAWPARNRTEQLPARNEPPLESPQAVAPWHRPG